MQHWIDECLELEKFHNGKTKIHGEYRNEGLRQHRGWSVRDTAADRNISHGKASDDLRLAKFFRANPALCRTIDRKDALIYMRRCGIVKVDLTIGDKK